MPSNSPETLLSPAPAGERRREGGSGARAASAALALALPAAAAARGDESLFVPTGNVVAIFWVLVAVFVVRTGWRTRALAILLALVAVALPHLAPHGWLASWLPDDPRAAFMLGFVPPLGTAALVLWLSRRKAWASKG